MTLDLERMTKIVWQVCKAVAPKFRSDAEAVLGHVWQKVIENWQKRLVPVDNPDAWIWTTAWREARRAFQELRHNSIDKELRCRSTEFDERTHTNLAHNTQARDIPDLLTRQQEQQSRAEQIERLRAEFNRLPSDQQVALLVLTKCQDCGWIDTEPPGSVVGLAKLWNRSRPHVYNRARRAERHLRLVAGRTSP